MTNCLLYAISLYMRRAGKGCRCYIAVRRSRHGRFPHFVYIEQRKRMRIISYVPIDARYKMLPPPLFKGRVMWGDQQKNMECDMTSMPEVISEAVTVQIAKLELKAGDTLAVMSPRILTDQQRVRICDCIKPFLPEGAKAMVLDGGMTLIKVEKVEDGNLQKFLD